MRIQYPTLEMLYRQRHLEFAAFCMLRERCA
jgi:hypothetical protein